MSARGPSSTEPTELVELRRRLEALDRNVIALIAEREALARGIGAIKRAAGRPILDPAREASVVRRACAMARESGVDAEVVREIFWQLIGLCRRAQERA